MPHLIYDSEDDAKQASRDVWEQVLGGPKKPENVTEFMWGWQTGLDGRSALEITEREELMPEYVAEGAPQPSRPGDGGEPSSPLPVYVDELDEANWPKPT